MKVLVVSSWFPYPADNGSRIRGSNLLQTIAAKHETTLLSFTDPDFLPEHTAPLNEMGVRVSTTPRVPFRETEGKARLSFFSQRPRYLEATHSAEMERLINRELGRGNVDLMVMGELTAAAYVRPEMKPAKLFDDLETGTFFDAYASAKGKRKWRRAATWWKMSRFLRRQGELFDALTVVSEREAELAERIGIARERVSVLPNAIDGASYRKISVVREPNTLIYSGAMTFGANLDAMRYFIRDIFPLIRRIQPVARLTITGGADQVAINELSGDNAVLFAGYVRDVRQKIASSAVCVVPLRVGGGTRLKILEAMALGTPVVSTLKGVEGLDVTPGEEVLIGETPQSFADQVLRLLENPTLANTLAEKARAKVYAEYDWKQVGKRLEQLLERVTGRN